MVRKPSYDAMVERPMAQRRICNVHELPGPKRCMFFGIFFDFNSYMVRALQTHPSWQVTNFFPTTEFQLAMERDSDASSRSISFPVSTPADIRRMFDPISYKKGASIIRMMNGFLGDRAFQAGLTAYLKKFAYSNAVQDDLWAIMTEYGHSLGTLPTDLDIKTVMDTWTVQPGYPVVTVIRQGSDVTITQQRYMLPETNVSDASRWYVPISYETQTRPTDGHVVWLNRLDNITMTDVVGDEEWMYVNVDRTGYYRVNYDYKSWIILNRHFDALPAITQAQLMDDVLQLARSEVVTYDLPLAFLLKLGEFSVLPWGAAGQGITYIRHMITREEAYEHFRVSTSWLVLTVFLGWRGKGYKP